MAIVANRFAFAPPIENRAAVTRGSFFKRLVAALMASREAQARREIARHMNLINAVKGLSDPKSEAGRADLPF